MLGAQKPMCFEHKFKKPNIKYLSFQIEQEEAGLLLGMCPLLPPVPSDADAWWSVGEGTGGPECLQGT